MGININNSSGTSFSQPNNNSQNTEIKAARRKSDRLKFVDPSERGSESPENKTRNQRDKITSPGPERKRSDPRIQGQGREIPRKNSSSSNSTDSHNSPRKSIDSPTSSPSAKVSGPSSFNERTFWNKSNFSSPSPSYSNLETASNENRSEDINKRLAIYSLADKIAKLCKNPLNKDSEKKLGCYIEDLKDAYEVFINHAKDEEEAYPLFWGSELGKKASRIIDDNFLVESAKILESKDVIGGMVVSSESTRHLFKELETHKKKTSSSDINIRKQATYDYYRIQQQILSLYWDALIACIQKISDYRRQKFIPTSDEALPEEKTTSKPSPKKQELEASKDISTKTAEKLNRIHHYFTIFNKSNKNQTILPEKTIWDDIALRLNQYVENDFLPTFVLAGQACLKAKGKLKFDNEQAYLYKGICGEMKGEMNNAEQNDTLAADQERAILGRYLLFLDRDGKILLPAIDDQSIKNLFPNTYEIKQLCEGIYKELETKKEVYTSLSLLNTFLDSTLTNPTQFIQYRNQVIQRLQKDFSSANLITLLEGNARFIELKNKFPELENLYFAAYQNPVFFSNKGAASLESFLKNIPKNPGELDKFRLNKNFFMSNLFNLIHGPLSCAIDDKIKELTQKPVDEWVDSALKIAGFHLYGDEEILKTIGGFIFQKAFIKDAGIINSPKLVIQQKIFECMSSLTEEDIEELEQLLKKHEKHAKTMLEFSIADILESLKKIYRISSQVFMTTITKKIMDSFSELFKEGKIIQSNPEWLAKDKWKIEVILDKGYIKVRYLTKGELFESCTIYIEMTVESNFNRGLCDPAGLEAGERVEIDMFCETPKNLSKIQAEEVEIKLRRLNQLMNILDFGSHFSIVKPTGTPRK